MNNEAHILANRMLRMFGLPSIPSEAEQQAAKAAAAATASAQKTAADAAKSEEAKKNVFVRGAVAVKRGMVKAVKATGRFIGRVVVRGVQYAFLGVAYLVTLVSKALSWVSKTLFDNKPMNWVKARLAAAGRAVRNAVVAAFSWVAAWVLKGLILVLKGIAKLDAKFENSKLYAFTRFVLTMAAFYGLVYVSAVAVSSAAAFIFGSIPVVGAALAYIVANGVMFVLVFMAVRAFVTLGLNGVKKSAEQGESSVFAAAAAA